MVNNLTSWLGQTVNFEANPPDNFTELLQRKTRRSLATIQQRASVVNEKLSAIDLIIKDTSRTRRAIIDGGGKLLEWLFGTATDEKLNNVNEKVGRIVTHQKEILTFSPSRPRAKWNPMGIEGRTRTYQQVKRQI